jgi:hypothetical protein
MLVLSMLNVMTSINRHGDWLKRAVSRGYLQRIVLMTSNCRPVSVPQPVSLKAHL